MPSESRAERTAAMKYATDYLSGASHSGVIECNEGEEDGTFKMMVMSETGYAGASYWKFRCARQWARFDPRFFRVEANAKDPVRNRTFLWAWSLSFII